MKKITLRTKKNSQSGVTRRVFCKTMFGISFCSTMGSIPLLVSAEEIPAEPNNLDEPTPWQEGDPKPVEKKIPAKEPEQTSTEAPPCQPMDDDRPAQPSTNYVWVTGYWWWTNRVYQWVPGYWALPPQTSYVYVSGYWVNKNNAWVYVRGGWAKANTTVIVVYPKPRALLVAFVIPAPVRIIRRHRRWGHYPARRARHRAVVRSRRRSIKRKVNRRDNRRGSYPLERSRRR